MSKTVAIVVGTRPEVIKMAPVYLAVRDHSDLRPVLVSTGQHRQMLDQALSVFGIAPDHELNLMRPGQALPDLTSRVIEKTSELLQQLKPSAVLVQGDTTTVLGTAIAAFYARTPIGHVEAGLRTYNYEAPWPEEMNRRLVDPICRWCFAPTEWSADNLRAERVPASAIHVTGNTVIDALLWTRAKLSRNGQVPPGLVERCGIPAEFAEIYFTSHERRFVLVTGHRRESFGQGFEEICHGIAAVAERYPDVGFLYPVHLNPNVQEPVRRILGRHARVALIPPANYEDFIWLMERSHFVLSDSGGVQEEAPSLGKPVLVMRETTERPEGVAAGTCRLVGADAQRILKEATVLLDNPTEYAARSALKNPYGDGHASRRIAATIARDLG